MGSAKHSSGGTYMQSKTMKDAIKIREEQIDGINKVIGNFDVSFQIEANKNGMDYETVEEIINSKLKEIAIDFFVRSMQEEIKKDKFIGLKFLDTDAVKGSDAIILTNEDAHIQMLRRMMHSGAGTFCLCHD